jgi:hypothetical protein
MKAQCPHRTLPVFKMDTGSGGRPGQTPTLKNIYKEHSLPTGESVIKNLPVKISSNPVAHERLRRSRAATRLIMSLRSPERKLPLTGVIFLGYPARAGFPCQEISQISILRSPLAK